jgi:hypothetical protein
MSLSLILKQKSWRLTWSNSKDHRKNIFKRGEEEEREKSLQICRDSCGVHRYVFSQKNQNSTQ